MMSGRNRFPFTATQLQELEHQALIFKYMVSGTPIPPDLIFTVKRSLESSLSSNLILHQPPPFGWNCFQMGFGRKIDPEPGRCRRTDGKKWRCSKEAYPDSKYCERHMHRGRNRSRKPVEVIKTTTAAAAAASPPHPPNPLKTPIPQPIPISSTTKNPNFTPTPSASLSDTHHRHHTFLYPHSASSKPTGLDLSSPGINTHLVLDSSPCPNNPDKDYRYGYGMKEEVDEQQSFFSESSGTVRSYSGSSMEDDHHHHPWQLTPLTMGSSSFAHLKQSSSNSGFPFLDSDHNISKQRKHFFEMPDDDDHHHKPITQKVMHHFFDEWPKHKDTWLGSEEEEDKSSNYVPVSTTQLSISIPNNHSSDHRDFFMTHNDK